MDSSIIHIFMKPQNKLERLSKLKKEFHVVSIRSTVKSGTNFEVVSLIEKESGKASGVDFDVVNNPEFLREGTVVKDYFDPPVTVIGVRDKTLVPQK